MGLWKRERLVKLLSVTFHYSKNFAVAEVHEYIGVGLIKIIIYFNILRQLRLNMPGVVFYYSE